MSEQKAEYSVDTPEQKQILTCADLKRMGIIESEEDGSVECCPYCVAGEHEKEDDNYPHAILTPAGRRFFFCCQCYDYLPVSALVGSEKANAWLDEALEKQTRMEFPHFQEVEGKKKVTLFALELKLDDTRHTIGVQFGDLKTSLNAHNALKLLELLSSHRSEITVLSQQLNEAAISDDMRDIHQIKQEWYNYRHEGDETGSVAPRQSDFDWKQE